MAKQSPQLIIGGVEISPDTIPADSIKIGDKYRWAAQDRIAAPTALQFIGSGLTDIDISGSANNIVNKGGMFYLNQLRQIATAGEPVVVVYAGRNLGKFCITDVSDSYSSLLDDGKAIDNKWSVKLQKYEGQ